MQHLQFQIRKNFNYSQTFPHTKNERKKLIIIMRKCIRTLLIVFNYFSKNVLYDLFFLCKFYIFLLSRIKHKSKQTQYNCLWYLRNISLCYSALSGLKMWFVSWHICGRLWIFLKAIHCFYLLSLFSFLIYQSTRWFAIMENCGNSI